MLVEGLPGRHSDEEEECTLTLLSGLEMLKRAARDRSPGGLTGEWLGVGDWRAVADVRCPVVNVGGAIVQGARGVTDGDSAGLREGQRGC